MAAAGQDRPIDRLLNILVSAAAVPVLLGALFKITHAPGADIWLKVGLYTEAGIFLAYALLYLLSPPPSGPAVATVVASAGTGGNTAALDNALQKADITPENLNKLGEGFKQLNTTITNMSKVADVVAATGDFTNKTKEVTGALDKVKDAYLKSADSVGAFNNVASTAVGFQQQMQSFSKNLTALNALYEAELKEGNSHVKELNKFYSQLTQATSSLVSSAEDAKKVQDQIGTLATNLGKLNNIYGNMLTAMQGK